MVEPEVRMRRSKRFSWTKVPERTLQSIVANLGNRDDPRVARVVGSHDRKRLEALAERELGRPPKERFASEIAPSLFDVWLDEVDGKVLGDLYEIVRAREAWLRRRRRVNAIAEQRTFIATRHRTRQLKGIVFREFVQSCKEERSIPTYPGGRGERFGPIEVAGAGESRANPPYPHQEEAQKRLSRRLARSGNGPVRAMVVLPTGAGKTDTIVDWTIDLMAAEDRPRLRVLWVAHQQELLDQAAARYRASARRCAPGFTRNLRVVHGAASRPSALGGRDIDIVLASIQSLRVGHDTAKRKLLKAFLGRPTIVVVDEAHHAGAPSYERLLDELEKHKNLLALVGLTATPRPTSAQARVKVRERFGHKPIIKVQKETLIKDLILARPRLITVETNQVVLVGPSEARRALRDDFSPEFMRQLANEERDELVVSTWLRDRDKWGRTLAFATSIDHAELLREAFRARGVNADALHSEVGDMRRAILGWFRDTDDAVLVSVGMLTEGVDLPAARTAFLARPTASHILLEQMQGRVLRGPRSGGDPEAYLVYFHDLWRNFPNVADPRDDLDDEPTTALRRKRSLHRVPVDVVAELEALFEQTTTSEGGVSDPSDMDPEEDDDEYPYEVPDPCLIESRLIGYYDLGDDERSIPVLAHHAEPLAEMIAAKLDPRRRRMPPLMSFFDDTHPPIPSDRTINALLDYVDEFQEAPSLVSVDAALGPSVAASEIYRLGDTATERQIGDIVQQHWESLAGVSSASHASFDAAVRAEVDELRAHGGARRGVEAPLPPPAKRDLPTIPRDDTRDLKHLKHLLLRVVRTAQEERLLKPSLLLRLRESDEDLPGIDWTNKPESVAFGWWHLELRKPETRGQQTIRINKVLQGPEEAVSDELLEFLIWHELLHHLLPGQGHRPPFRHFESLWPKAQELDDELDRLDEKWDLRPKSYS